MKETPNITLKKLSTTLGLFLLLFSLLGALASFHPESKSLRLFHLDRELNAVTLFSALLLLANGVVLRRLNHAQNLPKLPVRFLGFLFVFMAADECLKIHETLEKLTGIDWQLLYLPLILMAGVGWLQFACSIPNRLKLFWIAGAFAWGSSQLLEAVQWNWGSSVMAEHYSIMMISEEILEMSGSSLFLLTLVAHSLAILPMKRGSAHQCPVTRSRSTNIPVR